MHARPGTKARTTRAVLAVLSSAVLVLAACGDDDDSSAEPETDPTTDETEAPDIEGAVDALTSDECFEVVTAMAAAFGGALATALDVDDSLDALERVAEAAPSDVRADFEVLVDAFDEYQRTLEDAGIDFSDPQSLADPQSQEALEGLGDIFADPSIEAATDNIEAYFDEICPEFAGELEGN